MEIRRVLGLSLSLLLLASVTAASAGYDKKGELAFSQRRQASEALPVGQNAVSPQTKKDRRGRLWLIWEEWSQSQSKILLGAVERERILPRRVPNQPWGFNYSADICFDQFNRPFLTWANVGKSSRGVYVQELDSGRIWLIDSCLSPSTLAPQIVVDSENQVWVFWTRRDRFQEEIFYRVYDQAQWSPLKKIITNPRFPSLNPAAAVSEKGAVWLVWSGFNGRNYEIFGASWQGGQWSKIQKISSRGDKVNNLFPCVGFATGEAPVVAWLQCAGEKNAITLRYFKGGTWSAEQRVSDEIDSLSFPKMAAEGDDISIVWQDRDGAKGTHVFLGPRRRASRLLLPLLSPQFISNPTLQENEYSCFGDSITYGYINHERFPEKGYVPRLQILLTQKLGDTTCFNEGKPSETTTGGLTRIPSVLAAHSSRYVLIMEGTNDVVFNNISMDTTSFNLREMARTCLDYGAFPVLATIIPRRDDVWYNNFYRERINYLNDQIRLIAGDLAIPLVEQFNTFNDYPESDGGCLSLLSEDLKHPNEKGYQLMAQTWLDGMEDFYLPPLNPAAVFEFGPNPTYRLSWKTNPQNNAAVVKGYNIYKKETTDSAWVLLMTASKETTSASFPYPEVRPTIQFGITTLSDSGLEGEMAIVSVSYPTPQAAINLKVVISLKDLKGVPEITYKLSWQANPQNNPKFIQGYKVYKKEGTGDYVLLATLPSTTFSAAYTYTNPSQKIQFALATVSVIGTESPPVPFWTQ